LHKNIGPDFVDYQTVEGLIDANKVIVQYKSLSQLKIHDLDKTILILDEAKSILTQMESLQANNGDNVFEHWIIFDNLIKNLAKVIDILLLKDLRDLISGDGYSSPQTISAVQIKMAK